MWVCLSVCNVPTWHLVLNLFLCICDAATAAFLHAGGKEQFIWNVSVLCLVLMVCVCVCTRACACFCNPVNWSLPGSSVHRISRGSGLPFPSRGDLPNPGIEPGSPALQADSLLTELQGKPQFPVKDRIIGEACILTEWHQWHWHLNSVEEESLQYKSLLYLNLQGQI